MTVRAAIYLRVSSAGQVKKDFTEEGYSIPAQREACLGFIHDQGWQFICEYVDAGASARTADRPEFKRLLQEVTQQRIEVVVVHKIDRWARNLRDHLETRLLLEKAGAKLVSVTERLEETPEGRFMEHIGAAMAELYSARLGGEIKKGMRQKVKMGGWPRSAPLGYLNHRETIDGRSIAHIVPDPERAPLIAQGFAHYAEGDIGLRKLREVMTDKGLLTRAGKEVAVSRWAQMLKNPFYAGRVTWGDEEFVGLHEPLISVELFEKVQTVMEVRDYAGPRDHRHAHYLKGTLRCGECGSLLCFGRSKGRSRQYDYFFCLRRAQCPQPSIRTEVAEQIVEDLYDEVAMPKDTAEALLDELRDAVAELGESDEAERTRLMRRISRLEHEQQKLMQALYAGAIDVDLLGKEQRRISREIVTSRQRLLKLEGGVDRARQELEEAIRLASVAIRRYRRYKPTARRAFNRAIINAVYLRDKRLDRFEWSDLIAPLMRTADFSAGGSKYVSMVEAAGIEPASAAAPGRASTSVVRTSDSPDGRSTDAQPAG
jgi:site-specific DNA recombinase